MRRPSRAVTCPARAPGRRPCASWARTCRRPAGAGALTLTLEVGGVLTGPAFIVPAAPIATVQTLTMNRLIPAGQTVRWRVSACSDSSIFNLQSSASGGGLALTLDVATAAAISSPTAALTVRWVSGPERLELFAYNADTATFTETQRGLASGRASLALASGVFTIRIAEQEVLRVAADGTLHTVGMIAGGMAGATGAQLQFYVGDAPIARLTATGVLHVPCAHQLAPVDQPDQFRLGAAALNAQGVRAERFAPL